MKSPFSSVIMEQLQQLAKKFNLDVFILFGSRAKNDPALIHENSDYDFAFYKKGNTLSFEQEEELWVSLVKLFRTDEIDLININKKKDPTLRFHILNYGVALYEKDIGYFYELAGRATIDYFDFEKYRVIARSLRRENLMRYENEGVI